MRCVFLSLYVAAVCTAQVYRVDTVAGTVAGFGGDGGSALESQLNRPSSVVLDGSNRLYIADTGNHRVRRVDSDGTIRTIAGNGESGNSGDGGPATAAAVTVSDIAIDAKNNLYIASGAQLRVVRPDGVITTLAPDAGLESITAIAAAYDGTIFVADGSRLIRIGSDRTVATIATGLDSTAPITEVTLGRDGSVYFIAGGIYRINASGTVTPVTVQVPVDAHTQLALDPFDFLLVSGTKVWKVVGGAAHTLAGSDAPGLSGDGGPSTAAQVDMPGGMAIDPGGNIYFADTGNNRVRVLVPPAAFPALPVYPGNGLVDVWPRLVLQWTAVPWALNYEIWLGTQPSALQLLGTTDRTSFTPSALRPSTTYFWRVIARAGALPVVSSQVWSFTTSAPDRFPEVPVNPSPANYAVGQPYSVVLTWEGRAASRFDVYFGEIQEPARLTTVEGNRFAIQNLKPETTYYWRVVGLNETNQGIATISGSATSSATWQFTTTPTGGYPYEISTVAGANLPVGDGINATSAVLELPRRPVADNAGNVYFIDGGRRVRKIGPDGKLSTFYTPVSGQLTALALDALGTLYIAAPEYVIRINRAGQRAFVAGQPSRTGYSGDGGPALQAAFSQITSISVDRRGLLYIADSGNGRIRTVNAAGVVRTFAGNGDCDDNPRIGSPASIGLCAPSELATDANNNLFVYERGRILKITPEGSMSVVAGNGTPGYAGDGASASEPEAQVEASGGLAINGTGDVYFADRQRMVIRRIEPNGMLSTVAGELDPIDNKAFGFFGDGLPATRARFGFPSGINFDPIGNLLIADWYNDRIRQIDTDGIVTTVAGSDTAFGERGPARSAYLFYPSDVAVDRSGSVYIADTYNQRVRRVSTTQTLNTIAGADNGGRLSDVDVTSDRVGRNGREFLTDLMAGGLVEVDARGNVLFTDSRLNWMQPGRSTAIYALNPSGIITRFIDSRVAHVGGMTTGPTGELYISDTDGHRVLRIGDDGAVTTVAGTGNAGYTGDGGPAILAQMRSPGALTVSADGELFIAEFGRIRKVARDGLISTVANEHANGLVLDRFGNLFVSSNRYVYVLVPGGQLQRIAGRESGTVTDESNPALNVRIGEARGIAIGPNDDVFIADASEHRIRRLTVNLPGAIVLVSGGDQAASVNQAFKPLTVRILGRSGVALPNVNVRFSTPDGGLAVAPSVTTNASGEAAVGVTAGSRTGEYRIAVSIAGASMLEVKFRVTD